MRRTVAKDEVPVTEGSGDVFADLGYADPGLARAKAELAYQIHRTIRKNGWNQSTAAELMGIDQPKVSAIVRGRLSDFSLDRLVSFLDRLGQSIQFRFAAKRTSNRSNGAAPSNVQLKKQSRRKAVTAR
jgi:predicted XRE-type DNA-binding protein